MAISDFILFYFCGLKIIEIWFFKKVYKIHPFSNFQKTNDMLCKLVSVAHIEKWKQYVNFWNQMIKTTKITGQNFEMSFCGFCKLREDMSLFDSEWKHCIERTPFPHPIDKLKIWPQLTLHDLTIIQN